MNGQFELIQHDTGDLSIQPSSIKIVDGLLVLATSKGLYRVIKDDNKKSGYEFVPASYIGKSRVENYEKIEVLLYAGNDTLIGITRTEHVVLRKGSDGHYHWGEYSLKSLEGGSDKVDMDNDGIIWLPLKGLFRFDTNIKR